MTERGSREKITCRHRSVGASLHTNLRVTVRRLSEIEGDARPDRGAADRVCAIPRHDRLDARLPFRCCPKATLPCP